MLPELTALRGVEQSHFHHLDVYDHTVEVLRRLIELEADLGAVFGELAPAVDAVLAEPLADELNARRRPCASARCFHDVAKPATRGQRADGRVTFIGHDAAGRGDGERDLPPPARERALALLRRQAHARAPGARVPRSRAAADARALCTPTCAAASRSRSTSRVLSCADRLATRGPGQEPWIEAHLELAREVMGPALEWRAHGPPRAARQGGRPGRGARPGARSRDRRAARGSWRRRCTPGEVSTRDEAVAYARRVRENRRAMIVDCAVYEAGERRDGAVDMHEALEACRATNAFVWIGLYEPDRARSSTRSRASSTCTSWPSRTRSTPISGPSSRCTTTWCSWCSRRPATSTARRSSSSARSWCSSASSSS